MGTRSDMLKTLKIIIIIGKIYDFEDANRKNCYEIETLKTRGMEEGKRSMTELRD